MYHALIIVLLMAAIQALVLHTYISLSEHFENRKARRQYEANLDKAHIYHDDLPS